MLNQRLLRENRGADCPAPGQTGDVWVGARHQQKEAQVSVPRPPPPAPSSWGANRKAQTPLHTALPTLDAEAQRLG